MNENPIRNELTDAEMRAVIDKSNKATAAPANVAALSKKTARNILVIGCGDGGCNIASIIHQTLEDSRVIAYNTSMRAMENISADIKILTSEEDGTGKSREYSQDVFRAGSYKHMLDSVKKLAEQMNGLEYIVVTTTCDGGTGGGVSPMLAKFIADNMNIPVIIVGVYPSMQEDLTAQYNTMRWQQDVEKTGIPYMVFDNDMVKMPSRNDVHSTVNSAVATAMYILTGEPFGDTNISSIDNRDMYMLLSHMGGRIAIYGGPDRPAANQTLDDYLIELTKKFPEPAPCGVSGVGLFVKGPADFINRMDTSLEKFMGTYGVVAAKYVHVEESEDVYIGLVCARCDEASDRLYMIRQRYDEIRRAMQNRQSTINAVLEGVDSPLGAVSRKVITKNAAEPDLSALGI